jgi:hypothetical protein
MAKAEPGVIIEQVRARFERWRNSRPRTTRIPSELWAAAIEVARRDGVNRTAQALHLDGGKLKRLLMASDSGAATPQPTFVELIPAQSDSVRLIFDSWSAWSPVGR